MGAIEIAGSIISRAQERVEVSAQNMANMTTPGYKARRQFSVLIAPEQVDRAAMPGNQIGPSVDFSVGKLRPTGNPLDLAISGAGFFAVRSSDTVFYTRDGQFSRDADGRFVTSEGMVLQAGGGDLAVAGPNVKVLADGTVLDGEQPVAQLTIVDFADVHSLRSAGAGLFAAPDGMAREIASPQVHQGMLEASNVSTADEMLTIMAALRSAESGQKVVQIYDDLMGRAVTAFGQM